MNPTIGVYDSGVGGLSIFSVLQEMLPNCNFVYCSDNKNFPYGPAAEDQVISFAMSTTERLTQAYNLDLLVVACNTASTVALPSLRQKYEFPIVGVVPAIKPAAQFSRSKVIGLLATPGTIKRAYTQKLIDDFASDCEVIKLGSSALVHWAEDKLRKKEINFQEMQNELQPLKDRPELDTVVLACTHFPLLKNEIAQCLSSGIQFIDSSAAVAKRVKELLGSKIMIVGVKKPFTHATYTLECEDLRKLKEQLSNQYKFDLVKVLPQTLQI